MILVIYIKHAEQMEKNGIILLIFHKPLSQIDGQVKYISQLIQALSKKYEVIEPSEGFFRITARFDSGWLVRTFFVNLYLILWVILHLNFIRNKTKLAIMEDRYVIIPSLLIKSLGVNLISSVSDWGEDYSKSLDLGEGIMRKMFLKYSIFLALVPPGTLVALRPI